MKEQNELLEAALKLLNILNNVDDLSHDEWEVIGDAQKIVAQHRSEPQRLEGWINLYHDSKPEGIFWPTKEDAKDKASRDARQVHIREVVPVEWEPWTMQTLVDFPMQTLVDLPMQTLVDSPNYQAIIDAHNAEMERVTK
jgi:hypothetical protein